MSASVLSRLDYCISLLSGCPKHLLQKTYYKMSKTQLQDSSSRLINEITFHPSSELFTGCPSKHGSSISCQHSVTPFSLIQPLFICLTFSVSTLNYDSSAPSLTQELYAFGTQRPKHLVIAHFPIPLLLSGGSAAWGWRHSVNHCILGSPEDSAV